MAGTSRSNTKATARRPTSSRRGNLERSGGPWSDDTTRRRVAGRPARREDPQAAALVGDGTLVNGETVDRLPGASQLLPESARLNVVVERTQIGNGLDGPVAIEGVRSTACEIDISIQVHAHVIRKTPPNGACRVGEVLDVVKILVALFEAIVIVDDETGAVESGVLVELNPPAAGIATFGRSLRGEVGPA